MSSDEIKVGRHRVSISHADKVLGWSDHVGGGLESA
jgi:hypothetical protein